MHSDEFLDFMQANYLHLTYDALQQINATYNLNTIEALPALAPYFPSTKAAYGELTFDCPGNKIAATISRTNSGRIWNYRTIIVDNKENATGLGTPHIFESTAIFWPGQDHPCDNCSFATYKAQIVPIVIDYWTSFVLTLDPNTFKNPAALLSTNWMDPAFPQGRTDGNNGTDTETVKGGRINLRTSHTFMEVVPDDEIARCSLWDGLVDGVLRQAGFNASPPCHLSDTS
jgi:acetylcholinesterase